MLTEGELRAEIRDSEPDRFCRAHLFDDEAWLFDAETGLSQGKTYAEFKNLISEEFGSPPNNIVLVGSAKLGRSLNPKRKFKTFNKVGSSSGKRSDVDLIIVNDELFETTWRGLLKEYYKGRIKSRDHNNNIFRKFASLNDDIEYGGSIEELSVKMKELKRNIQLEFRWDFTVNYRIYKTMDDAFAYHVYGVSKLRSEILNAQ